MRTKTASLRAAVWIAAMAISASLPAAAQQINGVPGAPDATITLDGKQLPAPPVPFGGVINETAKTSKPFWPPTIVPPKGAPNVLLIMTDDQGYGVSSNWRRDTDADARQDSKFGAQIHRVPLDCPLLADSSRPHYRAQPSRGGLRRDWRIVHRLPRLRFHHRPRQGHHRRNPEAERVRDFLVRKNHNTPTYQYSVAGPYNQWPSGMGFDYFYGFMGGETDQWTPYLFKDHTQIFPWIGHPGYNLTTDMAENAIKYLHDLNAAAPNKPFFVYYVPGGSHSPHQPTKEWIDKFHGKFDMGYEKLREQIFANQKRLGVIPPDTQLTPWPEGQTEYAGATLPKWDSLSLIQKKLYAREAEVFAAYTAYTDHEIGRVIQEIEDEGKLDNTLIFYIVGDNGTSAEGTLEGTYNTLTAYNGLFHIPEPLQLLHYEDWGSDKTYPHMAVQWAWAFDSPFKWTKQVASHFGGTRQGMAVSWPGHITDPGNIRPQFHHVIDVVPTILEAAGIKAPDTVNGIKQKPIDGVSMLYTFDKANANATSKHDTQYFEMVGNRAIYHDGWIAATTPPAPPWLLGTGALPELSDYHWELYNIAKDYSENDDLSAQMPDKLKEMQALFRTEAEKHEVFPLDNSGFARLLTPRPSATAGKTVFTYSGETAGIPPGNAPSILDRDYTITAEVTIPEGGADGMIVTLGGRFGGYGFYMLHGKPVFDYNFLDLQHTRWEGGVTGEDLFTRPLTPGKHTIVFDFKYDGPGLAKGGTGVLSVDGHELSKKTIEHTIPLLMSIDETFDVGVDTGTGVDDSYELPFRFTGKIDKLTFKLGPPQLTETDKAKIDEGLKKSDN